MTPSIDQAQEMRCIANGIIRLPVSPKTRARLLCHLVNDYPPEDVLCLFADIIMTFRKEVEDVATYQFQGGHFHSEPRE